MSNKDTYVKNRQTEIDQWNAKITDLETDIEEAGADADVELDHAEQMRALRYRSAEAADRLTEIQAAHADRREHLKEQLARIGVAIKTGFAHVKAKFI